MVINICSFYKLMKMCRCLRNTVIYMTVTVLTAYSTIGVITLLPMQTQSLSSSSSSATSLMIQNANALPMQRAPSSPASYRCADNSGPGMHSHLCIVVPPSTSATNPCGIGGGGFLSFLCHQYPRGSCGLTELCRDRHFSQSIPGQEISNLSSQPENCVGVGGNSIPCAPGQCGPDNAPPGGCPPVSKGGLSQIQICPPLCGNSPNTEHPANDVNTPQMLSQGHIECIRYPCTPGSTNTGQNMLSNGATHPTKPYYPPPNGPHQTQGENPSENSAPPSQ
jgi:hypothetical protein